MSLGSRANAIADKYLKTAWTVLRERQGNPTLDIVRESVTGANPARGIAGTTTDVGLQGVECSWSDLTLEEAQREGLIGQTGIRRFACYDLTGGFAPLATDKVRFPAGSATDVWNILRIFDNGATGRVELTCRLEREK